MLISRVKSASFLLWSEMFDALRENVFALLYLIYNILTYFSCLLNIKIQNVYALRLIPCVTWGKVPSIMHSPLKTLCAYHQIVLSICLSFK